MHSFNILCGGPGPSVHFIVRKRVSKSSISKSSIFILLCIFVAFRLSHPQSGDSHCHETL